jgi:hypothetical protein
MGELMMNPKALRGAVAPALAITACYIASLVLPAAEFQRSGTAMFALQEEEPGYMLFVLAIVSVIYLPIWCANPLLWVGVGFLLAQRWKWACFCGLNALTLALTATILFYFTVDRPLIGHWLWVLSMAMLAGTGAAGHYSFGSKKAQNE